MFVGVPGGTPCVMLCKLKSTNNNEPRKTQSEKELFDEERLAEGATKGLVGVTMGFDKVATRQPALMRQ